MTTTHKQTSDFGLAMGQPVYYKETFISTSQCRIDLSSGEVRNVNGLVFVSEW